MDTLLNKLAEILSVAPSALTDELAMQDIPTWNSLTHIDLVVGLEEAFSIELTQDEIVEMRSIAAIRRILAARGVAAG